MTDMIDLHAMAIMMAQACVEKAVHEDRQALARRPGGALCHNRMYHNRQVCSFVLSGIGFSWPQDFRHSPANMVYFSLAAAAGMGPGWSAALGWSILPAALGNLLGDLLLVVVPFWISFGSKNSSTSEGGDFGSGS